MSAKCPKCQFDNTSDSKFCKECGTQLKPAPKTRTLCTAANDSTIGKTISNKYRLLEELGSGGMGVVYKADQTEPIKRSVALKIIKLGMDTKQVVARFETERQALAVMDHPNIAKVFDGGATDTGRPYFVMELVRGIPINEYCDRHKLSTRERLELFIHVCEAIQHAHQKGVIHRDLKPSNILVLVQEDKPIPKIIDFGIAKATEHSLTERTLFTEQGQLIGTPEYMSPEQAEMSGLDVDTRTDIYSLGVILYELIVGVLPFEPETLRKAGFGEIQRIIRETDPPKASTRLSSLGDPKTSIAVNRSTDPSSLVRELKGDLDWITVKAMAKDRTQRYASASELEADIKRYLRHEPVVAGPPSAIYRIKKYIRRHKVGVTAAVLVIMAMLIGIIGTTVGLLRATKAERKAVEEAETAQQVSDFLVRLFEVSDPNEARGNTITAREILDKGSEDIEKTLIDHPDVQARLMRTMGRVYTNLGLYGTAKSLLEKAVKTQRDLLSEKHPDTLISIHELANLYWYLRQYKNAEPLYKEVVKIRTEMLGEDHPDTLKANFDLASLYHMQRRYDECEQLNIKILEIQRRVLGEDHSDTLLTMDNLAALYFSQRRYEEAEPIHASVLEIFRRVLGESHPDTAISMHNLATVYDLTERYDKAESLYIESIEIKRRVFGEVHPRTIKSINLLARMYQKQGRYDKAEEQSLAAFQILTAKLGNEHERTQVVIKRLIDIYDSLGKMDKSAKYRSLLIEKER
jgi:non-specific serine/threonine protein kinase/serine/threonine-protein kinase